MKGIDRLAKEIERFAYKNKSRSVVKGVVQRVQAVLETAVFECFVEERDQNGYPWRELSTKRLKARGQTRQNARILDYTGKLKWATRSKSSATAETPYAVVYNNTRYAADMETMTPSYLSPPRSFIRPGKRTIRVIFREIQRELEDSV